MDNGDNKHEVQALDDAQIAFRANAEKTHNRSDKQTLCCTCGDNFVSAVCFQKSVSATSGLKSSDVWPGMIQDWHLVQVHTEDTLDD